MAAVGFTPIQLYYSSTASSVPSASNLAVGELAINVADGKLFYKDLSGNIATLASTSGAAATVSSVSGTGTVSGITLTGTVTTTGSLTLGGTLQVQASNFTSQTANTFLSAPNGSAGVPTFRAIVAADIPTLNQNTTGTASALANTGGWSVTPSGTKLLFVYNGVTQGSLDSSGNFIVTGNVTAYGTP